ncbi:MAG: TIM barrel protein, partial [Bombilactobacillus mellis]|nr:TIM barrel protein [Bombilactobacillus mellis]
MTVNALGIYEKALPQNLSWRETFELTHDLGFNFLEFSVDESDKRLARLDWTREQRNEIRNLMWETNTRINNLMLSGHRRFPLGSADPAIREKSLSMMQKAIDLCVDLGIHNIQMAGYD